VWPSLPEDQHADQEQEQASERDRAEPDGLERELSMVLGLREQ
jgi:hypothetical protein